MTQQTNPNPPLHQTVLDLVNNNANDAETRLQGLEAGNIPIVLSNGYNLGQELNLPGLGVTPTLSSASIGFGTGTNPEAIDVDVLLQEPPGTVAAYDFALIDTAALVDGDSLFKNSGIIDPVAGIQAQVQTYVNKTATGYVSSAALYADTATANAAVSITVQDDDETTIYCDADYMTFQDANKEFQIGGQSPTPFGDLESFMGYFHLHGNSGLLPQPTVLDADIIGGCLLGTTFQEGSLVNDQRLINNITTRDDIAGNISEVFSEVDKGATGAIRTRASHSVRTPLRSADMSASAYNNGSDDLAEVRMFAQDDTGGSARSIRLTLQANDIRTIARLSGLGIYVDNNAATLAGLTVDELYKTPTGEIRIVV